jgi:regulatory protein
MPRRRSREPLSAQKRTDIGATRLAAVKMLARRDLASGELAARLDEKGYDSGVSRTAVAELSTEGSVNDERFAHSYVGFQAARGHGPLRIAAQLRARGLAPELVTAALESGPDWAALAAKARRARFGPAPPAKWADKARQARFLQYRGFSSDHIRSATGANADVD